MMIKASAFTIMLFFTAQLFGQKPLPGQFTLSLQSFEVKAPAKEAFTHLMQETIKADPEKKGLLIIFKAKKEKRITLNINKMPIIEIIRYMCIAGNYKYKITGRTVNITDK